MTAEVTAEAVTERVGEAGMFWTASGNGSRPQPPGRRLVAGAVAGAAGAVALDLTTYLDMVVRARPASELPSTVAGKLAGMAGIELGDGQRAQNRRSALGALLGYLTGVGLGMAYGALRPAAGRSSPVATVGLGLAAMAAGDLPATALGLTDPRRWPASGWAADVIPHMVYGLVTAVAFDVAVGADGRR